MVTDRRVLLLDVGVRCRRAWEAPRHEIRELELIEPVGLRLAFGSEPQTFTDVTPRIAVTSSPRC